MMLELLLNTITLPPYHQQEAWFWVPIMIAVAVATTTVLVIANSDETKTTRLVGKSIGVMGMPQSGKTQFLRNLQGKAYTNYEQTGASDKYESFTYKGFKIKSGIDIGGSDTNIKPYYEQFLKRKDICIFLFDVHRYLDELSYRKATNARLDFINTHVVKPSGCAIIGTHVDKVKINKDESVVTKVQSLVSGKEYARLFDENFFAYNLTDSKDMDKLVKRLFIG